MLIDRRSMGPRDERLVLDLCHTGWVDDPTQTDFETSFGTLAWVGPSTGRTRVFEQDGALVGWARLTPSYDRIRRPGEWDVAPASLTWVVDRRRADLDVVLRSILDWAELRNDGPLCTSHAVADVAAASVLADRGYRSDGSEPFGIYLSRSLPAEPSAPPQGYRFTTMAELEDLELRAEAHRVGWDGSTRSAEDFRLIVTGGACCASTRMGGAGVRSTPLPRLKWRV